MTRQQQITLDQCRSKHHDALQRARTHLRKATDAKSDAELMRELENVAKAHNDSQVWEGVVTKLVGLQP